MMYQSPSPRPSVLIVEDEVLVRMHAANVLAEHGFDVIEAGSAHQALSLLEAGSRVGAVFTDVHMPGELDGLELAQLVRARWPQTVIVITSGHQSDIDHSLGHFEPKPYQPDRVARTIGRLMHRRAGLAYPA